MPKSNEQTYNRQEQKYENREVGQDEDLLVKGKAQDTRGLGSLVKPTATAPKGFVAPPMMPNEDPGAYVARRNRAKADYETAQIEGQKRAVKGLK